MPSFPGFGLRTHETASEEHLFLGYSYPKCVCGGRQSRGSFGADNFKGGAFHKEVRELKSAASCLLNEFVSGIKCPAESAPCELTKPEKACLSLISTHLSGKYSQCTLKTHFRTISVLFSFSICFQGNWVASKITH